jgi:zinc protease
MKWRHSIVGLVLLCCCGGLVHADSYRIVDQPDEIIEVLDNGMTVIAKRVPSPVVAVRAYAKTGGVYEGKWLGGGLSHLLEHLVAGGSNERRTEEQNRNLLQKIGNNSNAYTTYDHTCYYVNTTTEYLEDAVDLISGWMLGAKITPAEYAREYEVVQRELEMNKGEPERVFYLLTQSNRYRVNPARVPVIGYQAVIQGLSRDDVYGYYKLAYQPNNLVFAVAGDVEPQRVLEGVRKHVSGARPGRVFDHAIAPEPPVLAPRKLVASFPRLGQAKLELAFPSISMEHPDLYALDLLATILGTGESSILVEELRDRQQLVSRISAYNGTPTFVEGLFAVSMDLDADKIDRATEAVLAQMEAVKTRTIDEPRIARAKTQMRVWRIKQLQTAEDIVGTMAVDLIGTGDPHFSTHYVQRMQQVTAQQLQDVARRYFDPSRLLTTVLLPAESSQARGAPAAGELLSGPGGKDQKVTRVTLSNGVTLLHKRIATTPLVDVRMYSVGGLLPEDEKSNGMGNLVMQMLPRGTRTRSARQIAEFFDSIGGDLETTCGNNTWYWTMSCVKDDLPQAMEVYADVVSNPGFPEAEIAAVKERIIADIERQDADWHVQAMRFFRQSYFGPTNSPYRFMKDGSKDVIASATADQMRDWYQARVLKGHRVLAIFGDVDLDTAKELAKKALGASQSTLPGEFRVAQDKRSASGGDPSVNVARIEVQKTEQQLAGVVIGFKSDTLIGDATWFPFTVIDTMTSGFGYPTGYLFDTLRGRGLVYVVHADIMPGVVNQHPGTFFVYAGCDPKNVNDVVDLIIENIARCQGRPQDMQLDWFDRSKQLIITGDAIDQQTPEDQATTAALDEVYGLGYDFHAQFVERIKSVTIEQVRQVAREHLSECVVTVSTPQPELVNRKTGLRVYQSFPPVELTSGGVKHDSK